MPSLGPSVSQAPVERQDRSLAPASSIAPNPAFPANHTRMIPARRRNHNAMALPDTSKGCQLPPVNARGRQSPADAAAAAARFSRETMALSPTSRAFRPIPSISVRTKSSGMARVVCGGSSFTA